MRKLEHPTLRAGPFAALCVGLVVLTMVAFSAVVSLGFVNYDDNLYVTDNAHVLGGLNSQSLAWALTSTHASNWHPVTWVSHMIDVQLFGVDAAGHHLTSLLIHTANVLLLFWLLVRMTGALWRPAFVAALFAIHPLHVESVAWIAERKDVLSTLFWLLTTAAWLHWLASRTLARYVLVLALFALGLMAKPMLVTLPFTLLLLDYWPLERATVLPLWTEKLPLFALSAASSVVTVIAQHAGGAVKNLLTVSFVARVANAAVAYVWYLGKSVWPASLAVFYPHPGYWSGSLVVGSVLVLCGVTALALLLARRAPYLLFGWLWYLGTLVPVIGLVQVGSQATADRYTYVPLIGVFVALAWGLSALVAARPAARNAMAAFAVIALLALLLVTRAQVRVFSDSVSLFENALAVTHDNIVAENNLGNALRDRGEVDAAIAHYEEALLVRPDFFDARENLGLVLERLGRHDEAIAHLQQGVKIKPGLASAHHNLGIALANVHRVPEAIAEFEQAVRLDPGFEPARNNLRILKEERR
jgi:tetratricopeptide (TPR) repeat protein